MGMDKFILFGASGHAKVIAAGIMAGGIEVDGLMDDDANKKGFFGIPFLGNYDPKILVDNRIIIAIGNNNNRKSVAQKVSHSFGIWIDRSANVSKHSKIDEGTVVMQSACIQVDVSIGKHVIVNTGAIVDHDCFLADFVHISPGATLCGNVKVGEGTIIGAGSVVIPNITIGNWVTIGAGAVVINDVPDFAVLVGNPGKIIKFVK
jgi:sugar O-acyltransferase (sialic acid O-acetyltransferase NeuD family)